jgi:hypothetical protein
MNTDFTDFHLRSSVKICDQIILLMPYKIKTPHLRVGGELFEFIRYAVG